MAFYARISKKSNNFVRFEGKEFKVISQKGNYFLLDTSKYGEANIHVHLSDLTSYPYRKGLLADLIKNLKMLFKKK